MSVSVGDRVEFLGFGEHDPYTDLRPGAVGTVELVDALGTVHVKWDSGGRLGLVTRPMVAGQPGFRPDRFRVLPSGESDA